MRQIKPLPKKDFARFTEIAVNAYPGMGVSSKDDQKRFTRILKRVEEVDRKVRSHGLYEGAKLLGGLRLFDFDMTLFSTKVPVGGGGLLAVDLAHKKGKVARDLMRYFLNHYRQKKAPLAVLYPFRPDFYRKMGFGYGSKVCRYTLKPGELPDSPERKHVRNLTASDSSKIAACYNRYAEVTHGMFRKCKYELMRLDRPGVHAVGYSRRGQIQGYIIFAFHSQPDAHFVTHSLQIQELVYENREALAGLLAFLRSQADQVNHIAMVSPEQDFHFVPYDPRSHTDAVYDPVVHETNVQGVGLMYRVIDTPGLFRALRGHDFNGQTCKLKLTVEDSFFPANGGSYIVHFIDGKARLKRSDDYDVEVSLDVAEFSSVVLGVVDFRHLYDYGLAEISDKRYLDTVDRLFSVRRRPECLTQF